jgi:hypothetical protein
MRITAKPTKYGPAAPVTLSASLSRALKHRKTVREPQIIAVEERN